MFLFSSYDETPPHRRSAFCLETNNSNSSALADIRNEQSIVFQQNRTPAGTTTTTSNLNGLAPFCFPGEPNESTAPDSPGITRIESICRKVAKDSHEAWNVFKRSGWIDWKADPHHPGQLRYEFTPHALKKMAEQLETLSNIPNSLLRNNLLNLVVSIIGALGPIYLSFNQLSMAQTLGIALPAICFSILAAGGDFLNAGTIEYQQKELTDEISKVFKVCQKLSTTYSDLGTAVSRDHVNHPHSSLPNDILALGNQAKWILQQPEYPPQKIFRFGVQHKIVQATAAGNLLFIPDKVDQLQTQLDTSSMRLSYWNQVVHFMSLTFGIFSPIANAIWCVLFAINVTNDAQTNQNTPAPGIIGNYTNSTHTGGNDIHNIQTAFTIINFINPIISGLVLLVKLGALYLKHKLERVREDDHIIHQLETLLGPYNTPTQVEVSHQAEDSNFAAPTLSQRSVAGFTTRLSNRQASDS
jgi:hypothetical protein